MADPRSSDQRKTDTLAALAEPNIDVWVATASPDSRPHLVPLSLGWTDDRIVLATPHTTVTVANLRAGSNARLALGPTGDVVVIDAELDVEVDPTLVPIDVADAFANQAGWDPRRQADAFVYLVLRPLRIQAWREENELAGRTLMRDGEWLI